MQFLTTMKRVLVLVVAAVAFYACGAQKKEGKAKSGIEYQIFSKGKGNTAKVGDFVTMNIKVYVSDSMLFDSYKLNNNEPVPAQVAAPQFNGDIMEMLVMMKEGDSATFKVPQDSLFRQGMKPPFAKAGDKVLYNVKLVTIRDKATFEKEQQEKTSKAVAQEAVKIDEYCKANGFTNVQKTPGGVSYVITQAGSGANVTKGAEVTMNYTGMLTDGKKFDSNVEKEFNHVEPFKFKLGAGQVIKGWDEGIAQLNKGAKAKLIIPSPLAYGSQSMPNIPANSILVFDVEVVDFK